MPESKSIIVTGSSRGIGFAILEKFATAGWDIAFCSKNPDSVQRAKTKLKTKFPDIKVFAANVDVGQKKQVLEFGKNCLKEMGNIDVLVNNAGVYIPGEISGVDFEDNLEELMNINLFSAYWIGKTIIPSMLKAQMGHIFNISSVAGLEAYPNGGSYAITKFALQGYTRTLREELKMKKIRVTGVYPGAVLTDSWKDSDLPASRFISPNDIADLVYSTYSLSPSAVVEDIVIRPQEGDI